MSSPTLSIFVVSFKATLVDLKIDCFKIEGRLKTPEYVAASAKNYRSAILEYISKYLFESFALYI